MEREHSSRQLTFKLTKASNKHLSLVVCSSSIREYPGRFEIALDSKETEYSGTTGESFSFFFFFFIFNQGYERRRRRRRSKEEEPPTDLAEEDEESMVGESEEVPHR